MNASQTFSQRLYEQAAAEGNQAGRRGQRCIGRRG